MKGQRTCSTHGGRAPQCKAAAQARIAALVDPAINALSRAVKSRDLGLAVKAAKDLLDRAGVKDVDSMSRAAFEKERQAFVDMVSKATLRHVPDETTRRVIDVNYLCRLATIVLAGPPDGRGCDSPAAG